MPVKFYKARPEQPSRTAIPALHLPLGCGGQLMFFAGDNRPGRRSDGDDRANRSSGDAR
jgi:hypothetical protein